jgi:hypothetical protein
LGVWVKIATHRGAKIAAAGTTGKAEVNRPGPAYPLRRGLARDVFFHKISASRFRGHLVMERWR